MLSHFLDFGKFSITGDNVIKITMEYFKFSMHITRMYFELDYNYKFQKKNDFFFFNQYLYKIRLHNLQITVILKLFLNI